MYSTPINIGILAHADAGKTSITEQLLYNTNTTNTLGSVDKKSSMSDTLDIEKERGISVLNSALSFQYKNRTVNLIDTPGHIDFVSELDKCFSILDFAILVVSAVEGIQGQTLKIFHTLTEKEIPTIIFINKIDRIGADVESVFKDIKNELGGNPFLVKTNETEHLDSIVQQSLENLADCDDGFMEAYLMDDLPSTETVNELTTSLFHQNKLQLTCIGSAKMNQGISELLDVLLELEIEFESENLDHYGFKVFKIEHHSKNGKIYHIKNFGKTIIPKSKLEYNNRTFTINQLFKSKGTKLETIDQITRNDIGVISISDSLKLGDRIGNSSGINDSKNLANDCLKIELFATKEQEYSDLAKALILLNEEDPALNFFWDKTEKQFHVNIQGEIQIEILKELILSRFNIEVEFKDIQILYKETPKTKAQGYVRYWMPKPCWAILTFEIEPGKPNSGVKYRSKIGVNDVSQKYQNEVERAIPWALEQGIKGWEVTDIIITLIKGEEHQVHSNPGDFLLATPMGVMQGLKESDTVLLEPTYALNMKFNQEHLGQITTELTKINAEIGNPHFINQFAELTAIVPVAKALKFPILFNSITSGKGRLSLNQDGYIPTEVSEDKIRPYKGVNPLDQAQWILHNRGAYKADERKR